MNLLDNIKSIYPAEEIREDISEFVFQLCGINTAADKDIDTLRKNEDRVFSILEKRLEGLEFLNGRTVRKVINPAIETHSAYSVPYLTRTEQRPEGLDAAVVYKDRYNLLYKVDNEPGYDGRNTAINAHIDTVAPFFEPVLSKRSIHGRGACDDKGNVGVIISALKILDRMVCTGKAVLNNKITAMFVIEEETGGNGSLDLSLDAELNGRYESLLVLECTNNRIYAGNRGAVFFKVAISGTALEAMAFCVLSIERAGKAIRGESSHPLFPDRPVQTCFGIFERYGHHPSTICDYLKFLIKPEEDGRSMDELRQVITDGLNNYIDIYGDRREVIDPDSGRQKLEKHITIGVEDDGQLCIEVFGSAGHMGTALDNDSAIVIWAHIVSEVVKYKYRHGKRLELSLEGGSPDLPISIEGGQGFLLDPGEPQVKQRIRDAVDGGIKEYTKIIGNGVEHPGELISSVEFNKLHNEAFVCDPESDSMRTALACGKEAGIFDHTWKPLGWNVSCDARLFARNHPNAQVITTGAGRLSEAHTENESVDVEELIDSVYFTVLFLLKETGSVVTL
jgi:acetylornithine deacetylase/succinyl-diaminopimelate desuccinylase-like protein